MSKSYIFKVNDYKEIDLARISRENPEAEALIITGITFNFYNSKEDAILLLSNSFLERFRVPQMVSVGGQYLHKDWGLDQLAEYKSCEYHHCRFIKKTEISNTINHLRNAKRFIKNPPKRTIKVAELDISEKFKVETYNRALSADEIKKKYDEELYQMGGHQVVSYDDKIMRNIETSYRDKNLIVVWHGTSEKLNPEKVIVDGEVYVKEIPCRVGNDIPF